MCKRFHTVNPILALFFAYFLSDVPFKMAALGLASLVDGGFKGSWAEGAVCMCVCVCVCVC